MPPEQAGTEIAPDTQEGSREQVVAEFERLFYESAERTWHTVTWMGVPAFKLPLDLWAFQEIVFETRPDLIVEAGVDHGGTTLFFASLLDLIGEGHVIGIDIDLSKVDELVRSHPRITLVEGSSAAPEVQAQLELAARGRRVMVDLDSDHSARHVQAELRALSPLVSPGCYLVVEDTNLNGNPVREDFGPGPAEALEQWLSTDPPFDVDRSRERLLATWNRNGYLRRRGGARPAADHAPLAFERAANATASRSDPYPLGETSEVSPEQAEVRIAGLVGSGGRVLDLCCGDGTRARLLTEAAWSVVGIEPDRDAAARAQESCERVIVGDLERLDLAAELGDQRFDAIVAVDALERLRSPERVLEAARTHLRPEGHLVVAVRNVAHASVRLALLGGDFPAEGGEVLAPDQTRFFTLASIERCLERAGFAVGEIVRETEGLDAAELPAEQLGVTGLRAMLEHDPDARTRRFLIAAYPVARPELELQRRRMAALAHQLEEVRREAARVPALIERAEEAEAELARLQALVDQQTPEIESLRGSVLASSARVGELRAALDRARELLELRAAETAPPDQEAFVKLARLRRRLEKRNRTLEQIRPDLERLKRIERSLPYRIYTGVARLPGLRRLMAGSKRA